MPTKIIQPVDSIFCISAFILYILCQEELCFDDLYEKINKNYHKKISQEKFSLCLNFLYMIKKIEMNNDALKIIL